MKMRSAEVQGRMDDFEARLPDCYAKVKRGPKERKFNSAGYQIFRDDDNELIFDEYTEAQLDILNWVRELGLCDHTGVYRHQVFLINLALDLSTETGDPEDVLHKIMIHVTTKLNFALMDKRNLSNHLRETLGQMAEGSGRRG